MEREEMQDIDYALIFIGVGLGFIFVSLIEMDKRIKKLEKKNETKNT
jgi:hypothetical protein